MLLKIVNDDDQAEFTGVSECFFIFVLIIKHELRFLG